MSCVSSLFPWGPGWAVGSAQPTHARLHPWKRLRGGLTLFPEVPGLSGVLFLNHSSRGDQSLGPLSDHAAPGSTEGWGLHLFPALSPRWKLPVVPDPQEQDKASQSRLAYLYAPVLLGWLFCPPLPTPPAGALLRAARSPCSEPRRPLLGQPAPQADRRHFSRFSRDPSPPL